MEAKKTVVEKYDSELKEIEKQMQLFKDGEICDFELLNRLRYLLIDCYYDGKCEGMQQMREIFIS